MINFGHTKMKKFNKFAITIIIVKFISELKKEAYVAFLWKLKRKNIFFKLIILVKKGLGVGVFPDPFIIKIEPFFLIMNFIEMNLKKKMKMNKKKTRYFFNFLFFSSNLKMKLVISKLIWLLKKSGSFINPRFFS